IISLLILNLFFFFQAEDGIRYFHVTGVQTCALPICWRVYWRHHLERPGHQLPGRRQGPELQRTLLHAQQGFRLQVRRLSRHHTRSEERRVGKECRTRITTLHSKKSVTCEVNSGESNM